MQRDIDNLHRFVRDLEQLYGKNDKDAQCLRAELSSMGARRDPLAVVRPSTSLQRLTRQSQAKQHFHASVSGDLREVDSTGKSRSQL
jgi:hypothetical protein